jgi:integrase
MADSQKPRAKQRGSIKPLPSGSLRVRVYAGRDILTGEDHYLTEVVPAGPHAAAQAERARTRLLSQVDERRNPKTRATLNQLLDRYLEVLHVEPTTKDRYEVDVRLRLRPVLGHLPLSRIEPDLVERLYAQLRVCRDRCGGKGNHVKHRTRLPHECDSECRPVPCKPLSASSIRALHWTLSSAMKSAVRWRWIAQNPLEVVKPPPPPKPHPRPPTAEQAVRILTEAWEKDPEWGTLIWTAMTTGARRGELCALRREDIDLNHGVIFVHTSLKLIDGQWLRLETKTHQQRRIALDDDTLTILRSHLARLATLAARLDVEIGPQSYLFTLAPDASKPLKPDTVTQRYDRLTKRLDINTTFHKLRHYSATELISAGVDIRTVAGRLGHGGGGATTLKVYAAWVSEADQRAAGSLSTQMPPLPEELVAENSPASAVSAVSPDPENSAPYLRISADLAGAIRAGVLRAGDTLPSQKDLAARYHVAGSTAHRAIAALSAEGLIRVSSGKRPIVLALAAPKNPTTGHSELAS